MQLISTMPNFNLTFSPGLKRFILGLMLLCSALTGVVSPTFLSFVIVVCMLALLLMDELYLAFPFLLFYNSFYGMFLGVSLFRIFSILMLLMYVLKLQIDKPLNVKYFFPMFVYFVYLLTVLSSLSVSRAIYVFIDVICCVLLVTGDIKNDDEKLKNFFRIYVLVALTAYLTGTINGNELEQIERPGLEVVEYSRFMATFEDPNYMGFFYTIAIFATFILKLFKPVLRALIIITLYVMIISSLSITAIIVNTALWIVYFAVSGKISIKSFISIVLVVFLAITIYCYGLDNKNSGMLGDFAYRINERIKEFQSNDIGAATTGRTDLAAYHLEVYLALPLFNKLFGGVMANTYYIDPILRGAAHNEYVDMLLNVGAIGFVVMFGFFIYNAVTYYKKYRETRKEQYLFLFMSKSVWMLYAFTLTVFLDYRFLLFFLI